MFINKLVQIQYHEVIHLPNPMGWIYVVVGGCTIGIIRCIRYGWCLCMLCSMQWSRIGGGMTIRGGFATHVHSRDHIITSHLSRTSTLDRHKKINPPRRTRIAIAMMSSLRRLMPLRRRRPSSVLPSANPSVESIAVRPPSIISSRHRSPTTIARCSSSSTSSSWTGGSRLPMMMGCYATNNTTEWPVVTFSSRPRQFSREPQTPDENGRDYTRVGGPMIESSESTTATTAGPIISIAEIRNLLRTRNRHRTDGEYEEADDIKKRLEESGVYVSDMDKAWRGDGVRGRIGRALKNGNRHWKKAAAAVVAV
mmetsp:Transcript_10620/g.16748  ORF Transcript_10620/g.16748 Transcript_10620/m.16748 type:complete len:310 (-) Transcript_10620:450-1379(-)